MCIRDRVRKHEVADVVNYIHSFEDGTRMQLLIPLQQKYKERTLDKELNLLLQKSYTRILIKGELIRIEDLLEDDKFDTQLPVTAYEDQNLAILIDRFAVKKEDEENVKRIADSIQTAFYESEGECIVCLLYTSPSPRDLSTSRMPSSA